MRSIGAALAAAIIFFLGASPSHADVQHGAASSCEVQSGDRSKVAAYAGLITHGDTTASVTLTCPVQFKSPSLNPASVDPAGARLDYYDFNSNTSNGVLSCFAYLVKTNTITVVSLGTKFSCETAGGCDAGNNDFNGTGFLQWGNTVGATADVSSMGFNCTLPPHVSGNWLTGAITAFAMQFTAS